MPDNYVGIRENNRRVIRGGTFDRTNGRSEFQVSEDEVATAIIDLEHWLGGATISSVALTNNGLSATESHSSTVVTLTISEVSSSGTCDALVTCSDGRVRKERLLFRSPAAAYPGSTDFGWVRY